MPFDAMFLTAVAAELRPTLVGARVDKVQQPARDTVVLQLRGRDGGGRLLLSANGNRPRVHLTQARDVLVEQKHLGLHAERDRGRVEAGDACSDDDDLRGVHAGDSAHEPTDRLGRRHQAGAGQYPGPGRDRRHPGRHRRALRALAPLLADLLA